MRGCVHGQNKQNRIEYETRDDHCTDSVYPCHKVSNNNKYETYKRQRCTLRLLLATQFETTRGTQS